MRAAGLPVPPGFASTSTYTENFVGNPEVHESVTEAARRGRVRDPAGLEG